jgi:hypothetical protein
LRRRQHVRRNALTNVKIRTNGTAARCSRPTCSVAATQRMQASHRAGASMHRDLCRRRHAVSAPIQLDYRHSHRAKLASLHLMQCAKSAPTTAPMARQLSDKPTCDLRPIITHAALACLTKLPHYRGLGGTCIRSRAAAALLPCLSAAQCCSTLVHSRKRIGRCCGCGPPGCAP